MSLGTATAAGAWERWGSLESAVIWLLLTTQMGDVDQSNIKLQPILMNNLWLTLAIFSFY
jgi:hypothetical protein